MKLRGYGEDRLVSELTKLLTQSRPEVVVGPGDDCSVISQAGSKWDQLLKTDSVVEGIHFESKAPPGQVGWKALCRAISDVASMGGEPQHGLITLGLSADTSVAWVKKLYGGIARAAAHYNVDIVGGETVRTTGPLFITVSLTGRVERRKALLRSGARAGDAILVTGCLGGSIKGWHLKFQPRVAEGRWLGQSGLVHAMMDLSDGLAADLPRMAQSSGVFHRIFLKSVPIRRGATLQGAMQDGEDYELLVAADSRKLGDLLARWRRHFPDLPLSVIGEFTDHPEEKQQEHQPGGFHHF